LTSFTVEKKIKGMLAPAMIVVGMVIGFLLLSPYAIPLSEAQGSKVMDQGFLLLQATCTTCHQIDRVQNYQGSATWPEIIELMREFGSYVTPEEAEELSKYLQAAYPR